MYNYTFNYIYLQIKKLYSNVYLLFFFFFKYTHAAARR